MAEQLAFEVTVKNVTEEDGWTMDGGWNFHFIWSRICDVLLVIYILQGITYHYITLHYISLVWHRVLHYMFSRTAVAMIISYESCRAVRRCFNIGNLRFHTP